MKRIISTSMLSADFGNLERDTRMIDASASEWIHTDVMDGVFVPNITLGFPVMRAIRRSTAKFMDVHLMTVSPEKYVTRFAEAGADLITFHCEAMGRWRHGAKERDQALERLEACLALIRASGVKAGVSLRPETPVLILEPFLGALDLVLLMSVEPGFGGQDFMAESLARLRELRRLIDAHSPRTMIEVDGGISAANAREVWDAGADVIVAGNAIFGSPDPAAEIIKILESL